MLELKLDKMHYGKLKASKLVNVILFSFKAIIVVMYHQITT